MQVIQGFIFDAAVDLRQSSMNFGKCVRKFPQNENNIKIEASISLRRRDKKVKVHGEADCCNRG